MPNEDLQEIVNHPNETLEIELKRWLDFSSQEVRATVARHIAALANHGGGYLVFGFDDALTPEGVNPYKPIDRDDIAAIVKKYLEPPFQCDVRNVKSALGNEHTVVIVPPHGPSPVCARANGPTAAGKSAIGIQQGCYYVRKAGPESAPISTASEWAPVIRRCAMHERAAILSALDAALRPEAASESEANRLAGWHEAARAAFLRDIGSVQGRVPSTLKDWHWIFSYAIETQDRQVLGANEALETLRQVGEEVRQVSRTGWPMLHVFTRPGIDPRFVQDDKAEEIVECSLALDPEEKQIWAFDFWRVALDGRVTLVRPYWEDDPTKTKWWGSPGTALSPDLIAQSLAEFVLHASHLARRFEVPLNVTFRCEWRGLGNRELRDPTMLFLPGSSSTAQTRLSTGTWPVLNLGGSWPEIVASLAAPLLRGFRTDWAMTPQWVRNRAKEWGWRFS